MIDLINVAFVGLRARRARVALSASGVAIGIAAMVAVLGISASSRADILQQLDRLGTNLLTVEPGRNPGDGIPASPPTAPAMISRVAPVQRVAAISQVDITVRRNDRIPEADTGAITVAAAQPDLLTALNARVARGRFLDAAITSYPTVVLGADAAAQLGVDLVDGQAQVFVRDRWFTVVGVLEPVALVSDLDRYAFIGYPEAQAVDGEPAPPTTIFVRTSPDDVPSVEAVLPATANPAHPNAVSIGRPSDVLAARAAANTALTSLLLGLGAVALLVGGLGIANVMVVAVLERRHEIGLRRALGASRTAIASQFVAEAIALATIGGIAGAVAGTAITYGWAAGQDWPASVPVITLVAAVAGAVVVGAIAGLLPAIRAARLAPSEALRAI